jgi:hypothetical protein
MLTISDVLAIDVDDSVCRGNAVVVRNAELIGKSPL